MAGLAFLISGSTMIFVVSVFGLAPAIVVRLASLFFPRKDPRRAEMVAELTAVPRWEKPMWAAEQLVRGIWEGTGARIQLRRSHGQGPRTLYHAAYIDEDLLSDFRMTRVMAHWGVRERVLGSVHFEERLRGRVAVVQVGGSTAVISEGCSSTFELAKGRSITFTYENECVVIERPGMGIIGRTVSRRSVVSRATVFIAKRKEISDNTVSLPVLLGILAAPSVIIAALLLVQAFNK